MDGGDGFEPLFPSGASRTAAEEPPVNPAPAPASGKRKAAADANPEDNRRRAYSISVGPKFKQGHETPFRATNLQMIDARGNSRKLMANIVKDIDSGISFSDECDVVLNTLIHPESPKLITITLQSLDEDNILGDDMLGVRVPLYLNLGNMQWKDVKNQYGIDDEEGAWSVEMNRARSISSKFRFVSSGPLSSSVSSSSLESFVNEVMGRFGRYNVSNETNWDKNHKFFQPIDFKIRVGSQFRYAYEGLGGVRRGQYNNNTKTPAPLGEPADPAVTPEEVRFYKEQFDRYKAEDLFGGSLVKKLKAKAGKGKQGKLNPEEKTEKDMWENIDEVKKYQDNMMMERGENGLEQAAVPEHKFRMTSHMALSPSFRSAISQAMSYLGDTTPRSKAQFEQTFLGRSELRTHLATIVEAELKETDVSITRYQDPQALRAVRRKKIHSAYMLKKLLGL